MVQKIDQITSSLIECGFTAFNRKFIECINSIRDDDEFEALTLEQLQRLMKEFFYLWGVHLLFLS